ncbi:hypothetical protein V8C86DRAFT_2873027, partial [Haematococcus lacustris]
MARALSQEELKEFREIFDLMDRDKGGTLTIDEIKQLMDMLGMKMRQDELEHLVMEVDTDGSGQVDFDEFLQVMTRPSQVPYAKPDVIRAFQIFSTPGDPPGKIKVEHLEQMLLKYAGEKFPPEEIVRLINGLEVDPEGFVDYVKKVNLMM